MDNPAENGLDLTPQVPATVASVTCSPMDGVLEELGIVWSSVSLLSPEGQALLECVVSFASLDKEEMYGHEYDLVAAMIQKPRGADPKTGEVYTVPATTLLFGCGSTARFGSAGVLKSLAVLLMSRLPGPLIPPIRVRLKQTKMASGHPWLTFHRVVNAIDPVQTKGVKRA